MQKGEKIVIVLNKGKENQIRTELDSRITAFGLHILQHQDYSQPFQLPQDVATRQDPFQFIANFAQAHLYDPSSPTIKLPIATSNYKLVVDPRTFTLCEKFTNLQYANEAEEILTLAKWIQFREVEKAVSAAVAVNFYTGYDEKEIEDFIKKNELGELIPQQIQQIYEEHKDLFDRIQQTTKQQFLKQTDFPKTHP